jgi:hypothetical protein
MNPKNYNDINLNSIIFNDPIYNNNDEIFESVIKYSNRDGSDDFIMHTSRLRIVKIEKHGDVTKLVVEFLLSEPKFYEVINNIDYYTINQVVENSESWFGNKSKYETIENLFKNTVELPSKLHNFPVMTIYVLNNCKVYNKVGDLINIDELKENNEISTELKLKNIEFHIHKYNLVYICNKINITNYFCQVSHYLFDDSDDITNLDDDASVGSIEF